MILGSGLLSIILAVLKTVECAPFLEEEKIEPVNLASLCLHSKPTVKPSEKSPILLIHGLMASLRDWDGIHQALAITTNRRVCAVDLRNHGDSDRNNRSDVAALVVDIINFLDQKEMKKVNIVGHSLGGKTAVNLALQYPDRVNSIVVEDMRPNGVAESTFKIDRLFIKFLKTVITHVPETANLDEAQNILKDLIQKQLKELNTTETVRREFLQIRRDESGKWQWKANLEIMDRENYIKETLTPVTGVYEGPALFIYGTESLLKVGGDKDNIMKLFPKATLIPIEGAGHNIHASKPREFKDEVIKFINSLE